MWLDSVLRASLAVSTVVWVGGAVTGQIWMARARLHDDYVTRTVLLPQINWTIRRIYIPMAATAFTSGLLLAWRTGTPLSAPWVLFPIIVFLATIAIGSLYSLPEYARLVALLHEHSAQDPAIDRRIERAAWVNRIELALVLAGIVGIVTQARG